MTTKHAPGLWKVYDSAAPGYPFTVGTFTAPGEFEDETIAIIKSGANARLIAAAPDMLAALESAECEIGQLCDIANALAKQAGHKHMKVRPEDFGEKVRAAIAKAEGPQ